MTTTPKLQRNGALEDQSDKDTGENDEASAATDDCSTDDEEALDLDA